MVKVQHFIYTQSPSEASVGYRQTPVLLDGAETLTCHLRKRGVLSGEYYYIFVTVLYIWPKTNTKI